MRVLSDTLGLTAENNAQLSPDGQWILFTGVKEGAQNLFLASYDGKTVLPLTVDSDLKVTPTFSQDSKIYAYLKQGGTRVVMVGSVGTGAAVTESQVAIDARERLQGLLQTGGGYQLITSLSSLKDGSTTFFQRTFATTADAPSAAKTELLAGVPYDGNARGSFRSGQAIVPVTLTDEASTTTPLGNSGSDQKFLLRNRVSIFDMATSQKKPLPGAPAVRVLQADVTSDGLAALSLGQFPIRCLGDQEAHFGSLLQATDLSSNATTLMIPKSASPLGPQFEVETDPCRRVMNDGSTPAQFDTTMNFFAFAQSGTASAFRVAYVTTVTGDPEVRALERKADGTWVVYDVSRNPKP